MLISTGPVTAAGAFAPPHAASTRLAVTRTNNSFFILRSFLEIEFDHCRQVGGTVRVEALCQGTMESHQLQDRKIQDPAHAFRNIGLERDLRFGLPYA